MDELEFEELEVDELELDFFDCANLDLLFECIGLVKVLLVTEFLLLLFIFPFFILSSSSFSSSDVLEVDSFKDFSPSVFMLLKGDILIFFRRTLHGFKILLILFDFSGSSFSTESDEESR